VRQPQIYDARLPRPVAGDSDTELQS
jgi:hypothetical protein